MCRPLAVVAARRRRHRHAPKKAAKPVVVAEKPAEKIVVDSMPKVTIRDLCLTYASRPRDVASEPRVSKFQVGEPLPKKRRVMSSVSVSVANDNEEVDVEPKAPVELEEPKSQPDSPSEKMSMLDLLLSSPRSGETMNELSDLFGSAEKTPGFIREPHLDSLELTDDILHGLFDSHKSSRVNSLELTDDVFHDLFKSKESLPVQKAIASSLERTDNIFHGLFSAENLVEPSAEKTDDLFGESADSREAVKGSIENTDDVFHGMFLSNERVASDKSDSVEKVNFDVQKEAEAEEEEKPAIFDYQNSCHNIATYVRETDALIELLVQSLKEKTERIRFLERSIRAVLH